MHKAIFLLKRSSYLTALRPVGLQTHFSECNSAFSGRETVDGCDSPLRFLGGSKRFSAASSASQRQTGGKAAPSSSTVPGSSQRQSGGKSTTTPPFTSLNTSQSQSIGGGAPVPPQNRRLTNHLITIGACSVAVAALLIFYPVDWLKNFRFGEKETEQISETVSERVNQQDPEESLLNVNQSTDVKEEISKDLKPQLAKEQHEHTGKEDIGAKGNAKVTEMEHDNPTKGSNISASVQSDKQLSLSDEPLLPEIDAGKHENPSAVVLNGSEKEEQVMAGVDDKDHSESTATRLSAVQEDGAFVTGADGEDFSRSTSRISVAEKDGAFVEGESTECLSGESLQKAASDRKTLDGRLSISEAYHLLDGDEKGIYRLARKQTEEVPVLQETRKKLLHFSGKDSTDEVSMGNLQTVHDAFDLLELLHAAEKRQADLDARLYQENQRKLKEVFQQELKDAQAKELMYAEEADRLAKEVTMEQERAKFMLKFEREKADEKHAKELKNKEEETNLKLKKLDLLAKTQVAAAVAEQKASFLEDMKDMKLQLEALYMAFYTQSEEARQSHTIHKLAVGTFAMEDAMMRGGSVEKEVSLIISSIGGSNSDPLVESAIASLSQESIEEGTRTPAQLHQKFEIMTGALRELSLIPATGGGLLSHAAAKAVSALKVREEGIYSDGIEAVISQVRRYLADGKLADAADLVEKGVKGSKAEDLASEWVKHVRSRATMEQALSLLQAHATAVASSLA